MVKSIERITRIFQLAGAEDKGLTNTYIAKSLGVPKSTLSAFLQDLVSYGYLSLDAASKEYQLGPFFMAMAGKYLRNLDIAKVSQPFLRELAQVTGESCGIAIRKGLEIMLVAKENSPQQILHLLEIGQTAPLYATASGKLFLAQGSEEEINNYIKSVKRVPITGKTIADADALWREIKEIQSGSLPYNRGEFSELTVSVAAPVFDFTGQVTGALVVMTPQFRVGREKMELIERSLKTFSSSISIRLGFRPEEVSLPKPRQNSNKRSRRGV